VTIEQIKNRINYQFLSVRVRIFVTFFYTILVKNKFSKCRDKIFTIFFCKLHSLNNSDYIIDNIMLFQMLVLGVQKSSELFFVKFNLYSYVIVRKWLAA